MTKEFLLSLKAGDEVVIQTGCYGFDLAKVDRTTKSQIIIGKDRYWRNTGLKVGYCSGLVPQITQPTPQLLEKIFRETAIKTIRECRLEKLPTDALRKIVTLIPW